MNAYRDAGLGWLAVVFMVLGALIVAVNLLDAGLWFLRLFEIIPVPFGAIMLLTGVALLAAGLLDGHEPDPQG